MDQDTTDPTMVERESPEEVILDEIDEGCRWTPVALTLAASESEAGQGPSMTRATLEASEEIKATLLDSADSDYGDHDEQSRWTPVALRLARSDPENK
jgi:hypothetical protein